MGKRIGILVSGWCLTEYHHACHRPTCTCDCHTDVNGGR